MSKNPRAIKKCQTCGHGEAFHRIDLRQAPKIVYPCHFLDCHCKNYKFQKPKPPKA